MCKKKLGDNGKLSFPTIIFRGILYVIIIPTTIMFLLVGGFYLKLDIEASQAQVTMKTYLHNKYKEEFVVEKPIRNGSGFAVRGWFEAVAYPVANKKLPFKVMMSLSDPWDDYVDTLWGMQEMARIKPMVDKIMAGSYTSTVDIATGEIGNAVTDTKALPLFQEVAHKHKHSQSILYKLEVTAQNDAPSLVHYERVKQLLQIIKDVPAETKLIYRWYENGTKHVVVLLEDEIAKILHENQDIRIYDKEIVKEKNEFES